MKYLDSDLEKTSFREREIELLRDLTGLIKQEKAYITDGEKEVIQRQKSLIEDYAKHPEKDKAMLEKSKDMETTKAERKKLEQLRKDFLAAANKRIKKEDWEKPKDVTPGEDSYNHEDHMPENSYTKETMTNLRYSQIPKMNVTIGYEK